MSESNNLCVSICICTYKRPQMLDALLRSLVGQQFPLQQMQIVVVDNDEGGSAAQSVKDFEEAYPSANVHYVIEPMQGIAHARNRTVMHATADLLAFVDDDEEVSPNWLTSLYACLMAHKADAVLGPILPKYPPGTSGWVIASGIFDRGRFKTGTPMTWGDGHTGNALVKAKWLRERKPYSFDIKLAHSGGEDTNFFKWMQSQGGILTWCDEAEVFEEVPFERQRLVFILKRSFNTSVTYWSPHFAVHTLPWCLIQASIGFVRGSALLVYGLLQFPFGLRFSVFSWATSAKGFGRLAALAKANVISYGKK